MMRSHVDWQPQAKISTLKKRAQLLNHIRQFLSQRGVMEVDTPILAPYGNPAPYIQQLTTELNQQTYYLQTSPEFAMKRLLAAGSGAIFQLGKVFRAEETGRFHHPEFTMLEWYRPGFSQTDMLDEIHQILQFAISSDAYTVYRYQKLFTDYCGLDPIDSSVKQLKQYAYNQAITDRDLELDHDGWLQLIMSQMIEPYLGQTQPCFVIDYPASQAALARLKPDDPRWAERFELYYQGLELANGFVELTDADTQRERFKHENQQRQKLGLPDIALDEALLASMEYGLPACVGVALGFDRLLMLASKAQTIHEVIID